MRYSLHIESVFNITAVGMVGESGAASRPGRKGIINGPCHSGLDCAGAERGTGKEGKREDRKLTASSFAGLPCSLLFPIARPAVLALFILWPASEKTA
jgi:hypothetical protein